MSDQDFFFDEDEAPAKDKAKKAASSDKPAAGAKAASAPAVTAQTVSTSVAALIGVIALLAGIIIGIVIPVGGSNVPAPTAVPQTGAPSMGSGGGSAPQLSPDQLEGGALPEGHPDISGGEGGSTETTAK